MIAIPLICVFRALVTQLDRNVLTLLGSAQSLIHSSPGIIEPPNTLTKHDLVQRELSFPILGINQTIDKKCTPPVCDRFTQHLLASAEPVALRPQRWNTIHSEFFTVGYAFGSLITRHWSPDGSERYRKLRITQGFGFGVLAQTTCTIPTRAILEIFISYHAKNTLKLILRFNLQFVGLFHFGGPHHKAVQRGDMDYLIHQLTSRALGIKDVTTNGDTLLHVSLKC